VTAMLPPCGLTHHDEPPNDVSGWCAHWAKHGAAVVSPSDPVEFDCSYLEFLLQKAAEELREYDRARVMEIVHLLNDVGTAWFLVGHDGDVKPINSNLVFVSEGQ